MSTTKNGGLDEYGAKPFKGQQLGTPDVEGVNIQTHTRRQHLSSLYDKLSQLR